MVMVAINLPGGETMNQVVACQSESMTECAMIRERMVAGVSNDIPACELHGAWTDDAEEMIPEPVKRWDDPSLWKGVRIGHCRDCGGRHVLRDDRCWTCEQVAL